MKKDPFEIEREEMEKIGKVWVNIVRRDIPKHHRVFTTFHRKQLIDSKRFAENCQREVRILFCDLYITVGLFLMLSLEALVTIKFLYQVKLKVSRSLKIMRGAAFRTRKLARDMLLFWKRVDKEMVSLFFLSEVH